jgi:hypothetical protein
MWLLSHLKPERYGGTAAERAPADRHEGATVEASLRAMEPELPAPAEQLLDAQTLEHELLVADMADGTLPRFLSEQRPPKSAARLEAEARAAQAARGAEACDKAQRKEELSRQEFVDMCLHIEPTAAAERSGKRYR